MDDSVECHYSYILGHPLHTTSLFKSMILLSVAPRTDAPSLAARLARATHARDVPERPERSSAFVSRASLDARLSGSSLASRATLDVLDRRARPKIDRRARARPRARVRRPRRRRRRSRQSVRVRHRDVHVPGRRGARARARRGGGGGRRAPTRRKPTRERQAHGDPGWRIRRIANRAGFARETSRDGGGDEVVL